MTTDSHPDATTAPNAGVQTPAAAPQGRVTTAKTMVAKTMVAKIQAAVIQGDQAQGDQVQGVQAPLHHLGMVHFV